MLYLDKELVEKSRKLGFNLSKTFKNHLKQFMMQYSVVNQVNTSNIAINDVGNSPGDTTLWRLIYTFYCFVVACCSSRISFKACCIGGLVYY